MQTAIVFLAFPVPVKNARVKTAMQVQLEARPGG